MSHQRKRKAFRLSTPPGVDVTLVGALERVRRLDTAVGLYDRRDDRLVLRERLVKIASEDPEHLIFFTRNGTPLSPPPLPLADMCSQPIVHAAHEARATAPSSSGSPSTTRTRMMRSSTGRVSTLVPL